VIVPIVCHGAWKKDLFAIDADLTSHFVSQSAIFNFSSLLVVILLIICTCAYIHQHYPSLMDRNKQGSASPPFRRRFLPSFDSLPSKFNEKHFFQQYRMLGTFWKAARIGSLLSGHLLIFSCILSHLFSSNTFSGERLSPYVAIFCIAMGFVVLFS
jgi:hypothetical protein